MVRMRFFRPTPTTIVPSVIVTAVAAGLLYYILLCALNGAGNCVQMPVAVQAVLIGILWPWAVAVRFAGAENIALGSVIGFALSFIWVFILSSVIRWIAQRVRKASRD
jgi:hypothetical protein